MARPTQSWINQQVDHEIRNLNKFGVDAYVAAFGRRVLRENRDNVIWTARNYFAKKGGNLHPDDIYGLSKALNAVSHARYYRNMIIDNFNERVAMWVLAQEAQS